MFKQSKKKKFEKHTSRHPPGIIGKQGTQMIFLEHKKMFKFYVMCQAKPQVLGGKEKRYIILIFCNSSPNEML